MGSILDKKYLLAIPLGAWLALPGTAHAGVVNVNSPGFDGGNNQLVNAGDVIAASLHFGESASYSGDSALDYSANGLSGSWYTFAVQDVFDVTVNVTSQFLPVGFSPGMTVWATGDTEFAPGNILIGGQMSSAGATPPGSFNATGSLGANGTLWLADAGVKETLGYAVSGPGVEGGVVCLAIGCPSVGHTGWQESIIHGAHDVSITDIYEQGVSGSVSAIGQFGTPFDSGAGAGPSERFAELEFNNLQPGWYAVFVGGTDSSQTGGYYDLTISAVPEVETWLMMLVGAGFLARYARKR